MYSQLFNDDHTSTVRILAGVACLRLTWAVSERKSKCIIAIILKVHLRVCLKWKYIVSHRNGRTQSAWSDSAFTSQPQICWTNARWTAPVCRLVSCPHLWSYSCCQYCFNLDEENLRCLTWLGKTSALPRTGGSVSWASGCYAGGREFDSGWTNTQGLKITE